MNEQANNAIVFYHANCNDGFGAAWAFSVTKGMSYKNVAYHAISYGTDPFSKTSPTVDDPEDLYILDFSFSRPVLTALCAVYNQVKLIDHHKTAQEDLTGWIAQPANLVIIFNMQKCGAMLTWNQFATPGETKDRVPPIISYIQDRDLWTKVLPNTEEIHAALANTPKTLVEYQKFNSNLITHPEVIRDIGYSLLQQHKRICEDIINDAREITIETDEGNYTGLVCNCTAHFASDVGHLLQAQSGTFGATYYTAKSGGVKWSLRSEGDYDVSKIAKCFGGGGHKNAAGFFLIDKGTDTDKAVRLWSVQDDNTRG